MNYCFRTFSLILTFAILIFSVDVSCADNGKHKGQKKHHKAGKKHTAEKHHQHESVAHRAAPPSSAPVMAHSCPFSCASLRIDKSHCRDWREGNTCFVQDTASRNVPYKIISAPIASRNYYMIEAPQYGEPQVSAGQIVGDKIDRAINNVLTR